MFRNHTIIAHEEYDVKLEYTHTLYYSVVGVSGRDGIDVCMCYEAVTDCSSNC